MRLILPDIISEDQTGFMMNRDISTNIRKVIDIIEYAKVNNIASAIMSIDLEKCFDRIETSTLVHVLDYFNFGVKFQQYSKLLFADFTARVQNNGYLSSSIPVTRSLHQGCPSSPYYFLLYGQILNMLIKSHKDIRGIRMYDVEQLLSQFADDTDLFLMYDQLTFTAIEQVFEVAFKNMGLKVNYNKTTVYRIGSICNTNATLYTIKPLAWTNDPINVLGVLVSNDTSTLTKNNFQGILERIKVIVSLWHNRNLSLSGKVLIVNALINSLLVYKMRVLPNLPREFFKELNAIITKFLWGGRRAKIARDTLTCTRALGGLKLGDMWVRQKAFKIQWIYIHF